MINVLKKAVKGFEAKLGLIEFAKDDVESQLNYVMWQTPVVISKEFTQCKSLGGLLSYSFREDALDLQFALKILILYTRSQFQKTRKELLLSSLASGAKKRTFLKHALADEKDYQSKYTQYGAEKAYSLLMANNAHIRKRIQRYKEQYIKSYAERIQYSLYL